MIKTKKNGALWGEFETPNKAVEAIKKAENLTSKSVVKFCYNDFFMAYFIKINASEYMIERG